MKSYNLWIGRNSLSFLFILVRWREKRLFFCFCIKRFSGFPLKIKPENKHFEFVQTYGDQPVLFFSPITVRPAWITDDKPSTVQVADSLSAQRKRDVGKRRSKKVRSLSDGWQERHQANERRVCGNETPHFGVLKNEMTTSNSPDDFFICCPFEFA